MGHFDRDTCNATTVLLERGDTKNGVVRFTNVNEGRSAASTTDECGWGSRRPLAPAGGGGGACRLNSTLVKASGRGCGQPCGTACLTGAGIGPQEEFPLGAAVLEGDVSGTGAAGAPLVETLPGRKYKLTRRTLATCTRVLSVPKILIRSTDLEATCRALLLPRRGRYSRDPRPDRVASQPRELRLS